MPDVRRKTQILLVQVAVGVRLRLPSYRLDPEEGFVEKYGIAPVSAATISALTPDEYEVDIWDETQHGTIDENTTFDKHYDIVGISAMFDQLGDHVLALGPLFKKHGAVVVAGGPAVSSTPEKYRGHFDAIFVNEAEYTWPRFLKDFEAQKIESEYRQIEKPAMTDSPPPRWGNIAGLIPKYAFGAVQTTRGCPFDCEFCDVIYLYGRKQRHKPVAQVVEELRVLERLGARSVFVTDDEFVGDFAYAKELLREIVLLQRTFAEPLSLFTQLTLNVTRDDELLQLLADANFESFCMGIESFNVASLRETSKLQNVRKDIATDLQKVGAHGIALTGSFIIGFDHDGPGAFDLMYENIQRACVQRPKVYLLTAFAGTRLWSRLRQENRLLKVRPGGPVKRSLLNFVPKQMSRQELLTGYVDFLRRLYDWDAIRERSLGWLALITRPPEVHERQLSREQVRLVREKAKPKLSVSPRAVDVFDEVMAETFRAQPTLVNRMVSSLLYNAIAAFNASAEGAALTSTWSWVREAEMYKRLDAEGMMIPDDTAVMIPPAFKEAIQDAFWEVYRRLYVNLPNREEIAETATEVFVDFLLRWGATFEKLEPHHRVMLVELADRASAKRCGTNPESFVPATRPTAGMPAESDIRRSRIADAVLKNVRDELARFNTTRA